MMDPEHYDAGIEKRQRYRFGSVVVTCDDKVIAETRVIKTDRDLVGEMAQAIVDMPERSYRMIRALNDRVYETVHLPARPKKPLVHKRD